MNSFLDSESLAVRTPLDKNAMVVVDIAPETLVLLRGEVLRAPDEDGSIFGTACKVFSIGTQIKIFIIKVIISKLEIRLEIRILPRTRPLWPFSVDRSQGC